MQPSRRQGPTPSKDGPEPLLPQVAAALDPGPVVERLRRIAEHSPARERYSELELIHDGPGGRVLRAWDEDLQREVALKEITVPADTDDERLARFIDEARITSQLDHTGIVGVHEVGADANGRVYYTMPLVRGSTFAEAIRRLHDGDDEWSLPRAVGVLASACEAIAYAHSRGVVHQDLKPENVLVGAYGQALVTDWGLARMLAPEGEARVSRVGGTPAYMAPEVPHEGGSFLADVYALGATLYAVLTGTTPHEATVLSGEGRRSLEEVLAQPPRSVTDLAPDAPRELVAVVERAMAHLPADRYPSADALARDLRDWLEGRVVHAYESGPLAELRKWHGRNRGLALALHALAVLALVSSGVVLWLQSERARDVAAKEAEVDQRSYAAEIRQASLSLRSGSVSEAREALAACPPDLRGWEWEHLDLRRDTSLASARLFAREDPSVCTQIPERGLYVGGSGGTLLRIDARTLERLAVREDAHDGSIELLVASSDGKTLFTAGARDVLRSWDPERLEAGRAYDLGGLRPKAVLAHERRAFFFSTSGALHVLDLDSGAVRDVEAVEPGFVSKFGMALAGTPTRLVVSLGNGSLMSLDPDDVGTPVARRFLGLGVRDLAALGDAELLVGTWHDGLLILDPSDLAPTRPGKSLVDERIRCVAATQDGGYVVAGTAGGPVHLLDALDAGLKGTARLLGHEGDVIGAWLAPNGRRLTTIAFDGTARTWSVDRAARQVVDQRSTPRMFALSPDGGMLVGADWDGTVVVRERSSGLELHREPTEDENAMATFANGGRLLVVVRQSPDGGTDTRVLETRSWTVRAEWSRSPRPIPIHELRGANQAPRFATHAADGTVSVFDANTAMLLREVSADPDGPALALSDAGDLVAIPLEAGGLAVISVDDGEAVATAQTSGALSCAAFDAANESLWVGDRNGRIHRLDLDTGRWHPFRSESGRIRAVAPTPDGSRLAVSAGEDPKVHLLDTARENRTLSLEGHGAPAHGLAFSADGKVLVSGSPDGTLRTWLARP